MENDGHEEKWIYGRTNHRFSQAADAGMTPKKLCHNGGYSDTTFYKWRTMFTTLHWLHAVDETLPTIERIL